MNMNTNVERQLLNITAVKRQFSVKIEHLERLRRITKNTNELVYIEHQLFELRMLFLDYAYRNF
ncbi:AC29 [Alphabaculovirus altermyunipunctae]|jgi:hypothetical protein|uniref:AC29 n=1 Tax=Mythimna unipuncta nucleopolyhedrovirus TaxID=447897 RepID=A0A346TPG3_9ABAC|nr:AC29 [Mythimna unipuncta nucleopolyhedrovirus]AXU41473.1 AC29 [Mythimna unipuncta nucleopolyhedrovirus]